MSEIAGKPAFPLQMVSSMTHLRSRWTAWARTVAAAILMASLLAGLAGLQWQARIDTRQAFFERFETRALMAARYVDAYLATQGIPQRAPVEASAIGRSYLSSVSPVPQTKVYLLDAGGRVVASGQRGYGHELRSEFPGLARANELRRSGFVNAGSREYYYRAVALEQAPWTLLLAGPTDAILEPLEGSWAVWTLLAALSLVAGVTLTLLHRVSTARTRLDETVAGRTAQLREANQELEAFAYSVSHDLRAPLRGIDGFSQILSDELKRDLSPEAQRYLYRIRFNAQRMQELIDDLLRFSRLSRQALRMERVDINKMVNDIRLLMEAETDSTRCTWKVDRLPSCEGDPGLVRQVFLNLLDNARKYSGHRDDPVIEVGSYEDEEGTVYFVRDNGVGFDMAYANDLFGVFQRLHKAEDYPGTGVGLATVQRIVRKHGGRVWAESAPDRGATFYFTLGKG